MFQTFLKNLINVNAVAGRYCIGHSAGLLIYYKKTSWGFIARSRRPPLLGAIVWQNIRSERDMGSGPLAFSDKSIWLQLLLLCLVWIYIV